VLNLDALVVEETGEWGGRAAAGTHTAAERASHGRGRTWRHVRSLTV
jgi:hypothetical protein